MKPAILLIAALLLPLAGCLGTPEGAIDLGDQVTATVTVKDAASGETVIEDQEVSFVVGQGDSGLGLQFERALRGDMVNDTFHVEVRDDRSLEFRDAVSRPAFLGDNDMVNQASPSDWESAFGEPAEVGKEYDNPFSFYPFRVEAVDNTTVTYRIMAVDGQVDPADSIAADIRTHVDAAAGTFELEILPRIGSVFVVQPPSPFAPGTFQNLEPGSYQQLGRDQDELRYGYNAGLIPDVLGRDLVITGSIDAITAGADRAIEPVDGNYGVRESPVINGVPTA